ncbi:MAG: substrate-binding domain-containing protein [Hyphomicrobiales bacterium]|nr:substrate-binding domain-containing protein [Hyphomicrobiales bacterium]
MSLTVISSMATRQILAELGATYLQRHGCDVATTSIGGVEAVRRVSTGEAFDLVVLAQNAMSKLEVSGNLLPGSRAEFARSSVAVAIRSGEERPRIDDEQEVKETVLKARALAYSSGPSGDHLMRLVDRWGIAGSISQRLVQAPPGVPVGSLLARGEADLGFQQLSELLDIPGVEVLGLLPAAIQSETVFSVGICSRCGKLDEARELIGFLTSPETGAAKRRHGLEPV